MAGKQGKKLIETVCAGNNGRSPAMEVIGREYLVNNSAYPKYDTISSGVYVDTIKQKTPFPIELMREFVDLGMERMLFTDSQLRELEAALRDGNDGVVRKYFDVAADRFSKEERDYRTRCLTDLGLQGKAKQGHDQTKARPEVIAVLTADKRTRDIARQIYEKEGCKPLIEVMSVLATGDENAEVASGAFGKGYEDYRKVFMQIVRETPRAIDEALRRVG